MVTAIKHSRRFLKEYVADRRGTTAIAMAILTPLMVAGLAFGSEVGYWQLTQRRLQNAADTAAFAAGTQLRSGLELEEMKVAALTVANDSGFVLARDDASDADRTAARGTITLASPPAAGAYAGDDDAVHVALRASVERRFSKIFTSDPISVAAEATVQVLNGRPACVLALAPTAPGAVTFSGNTKVRLEGCDVAANSISATAVDAPSGSVDVTTNCVSTVGGVSDTHNTITLSECPEFLVNMPVTRDPYADRAEPAAATTEGCQPAAQENQWLKKKGVGHPAPGRYCGGMTVKGDVDLSPGLYILDGGSWRFNASADVEGQGVSLYVTGGAQVDINGGARFNIDPMSTGELAGIAIFFDRDDAGIEHKLNGGSDMSLTGAVYAPTAQLQFNGNTSSGTGGGGCTQVIAQTVELTGDADFRSECVVPGMVPIRTAQTLKIVE